MKDIINLLNKAQGILESAKSLGELSIAGSYYGRAFTLYEAWQIKDKSLWERLVTDYEFYKAYYQECLEFIKNK